MYMQYLIIVRPHNYSDKQAHFVKQSLTFCLIDRPSFATDHKSILCSHVRFPTQPLVRAPKCLSFPSASKINTRLM